MNNQISLFDNNSEFYESDMSSFNKTAANFRVHASLIYKLGESLIADEVTALSELIKNAYDADATFCSLLIDTSYRETVGEDVFCGKIELVDNGCGMDLSTIVNGWLTLSNSPKKKMKKEKKTTNKYHRYPLGDKGLGRLSVQKLGKNMQLITKNSQSNIEYSVNIPWGDFLKNTTIDQISITINENEIDNDKSYTKIIIKDLVDNDLWNKSEQVNILSNTINKIVSPFRSKENNFKVIASVNGKPIETVETIFNEILSRAIAKHVITYANGKSTIHSSYTPSFLYNRDLMKEIRNNRFSINKSSLTDFWNTYKLKLSGFNFDSEKRHTFISEDFCIFEELTYTGDLSENADPGEFECEIYEYTLDPIFIENYYQNISFSASINQKEYREFVNRFHGIKVIRDGFIVQGFGEGDGGDWLGLASSSKTTGRYNDLRNDSVIGCVYLAGKKNYVLKETTNREGFVEDGFYLSFRKILSDSIKRINKNRDKLNSSMRSYLRGSINTTADASKNALVFQPVIDEIKGKLEEAQSSVAEKSQAIADTLSNFVAIKSDLSNNPFVSQETTTTFENTYSNIQKLADNYTQMDEAQQYLAKRIDEISFEYEILTDKLQDLFELAGLGLSVEMFAHEFDSSIRNIRSNNDKLLASDSPSNEALVHQLHYVNVSLDTLRKQMSYFNPGLKFVRSKKQTISFLEFIQDHKSFYSERCKAKNIEYIIDIKSDFKITVNRGMLNQVFDNLFNNSEYWLNFSEKREFTGIKTFTVQSVEKGIVIVFDNGIGVSEDIENRLFEPFETKKEENGRGLGLYIVANNLMYHSARVRLLGERNSHGKLFKFELDFSPIMSD